MLKAVCLIHFKPRLSNFIVGAVPIKALRYSVRALSLRLLEEVVVGVAGEGDGDACSVFEPCGVVVAGIVAVESLERKPCQQLRHIVAENVGQRIGVGVEKPKFKRHILALSVGVEVGEMDIGLEARPHIVEPLLHTQHTGAFHVGCEPFGFGVYDAVPCALGIDDVEDLLLVNIDGERVFWVDCVCHDGKRFGVLRLVFAYDGLQSLSAHFSASGYATLRLSGRDEEAAGARME